MSDAPYLKRASGLSVVQLQVDLGASHFGEGDAFSQRSVDVETLGGGHGGKLVKERRLQDPNN